LFVLARGGFIHDRFFQDARVSAFLRWIERKSIRFD
jgi:hypothetical protein